MDKLWALLLASSSFARYKCFVPALPWAGRTLFEHQLNSVERSGAETTMVVLGHRAHELIQLAVFRPRVRKVVDPRYVRGNASALRVGLYALRPVEASAVLVLPVEYPVDVDYLEAFITHGIEKLREGAPAVVTATRRATAFPVLLGARAVQWCMRRRRQDGTLRSRMNELGAVAIAEPRAGYGGPAIRNLKEYEEARERLAW